ncbi:TetR/AcrR family transcriptional regulator [Cellulomonas citrea]|uniref:TetR/AcrR family transcriptional regulator n=1 Tax=Cellulomonas citrea TaxID=1909423 RepID=UPI001357B7F5|nr:TetR family transcriptional regulator [Cellulomonas citrea]
MTRMPVAERRQALVDATIRVIVRDGVAAATTRAVAAEAQMPLASLHYAFGSRDALLRAVAEEVTGAELSAARDGLLLLDEGDGQTPIAELMLVGVDRFVDLLVEHPERELALAELTVHARRTGMDDLLDHVHTVYQSAAEANLVHAAAQAHVRWTVPVAEVAEQLVMLLDGLTWSWIGGRDEGTARRNGRFAAQALARLAEPVDHPARAAADPR